MRARRSPEVVAGRVNSDGTVASGDGFTIVRAAAGTYNIVIPNFHFIGGSANYMVWETGGSVVIDISAQTFRVLTFNSGGGNIDKAFVFVAVGMRQ